MAYEKKVITIDYQEYLDMEAKIIKLESSDLEQEKQYLLKVITEVSKRLTSSPTGLGIDFNLLVLSDTYGLTQSFGERGVGVHLVKKKTK